MIDEYGWNSPEASSIAQVKLAVRQETEKIYVVSLDNRCSLQGMIGSLIISSSVIVCITRGSLLSIQKPHITFSTQSTEQSRLFLRFIKRS